MDLDQAGQETHTMENKGQVGALRGVGGWGVGEEREQSAEGPA